MIKKLIIKYDYGEYSSYAFSNFKGYNQTLIIYTYFPYSSYVEVWKEAMDEVIVSLLYESYMGSSNTSKNIEDDTFEMSFYDGNSNYKDGTGKHYKIRLMVKLNTQKEIVDYNEIFSLVVKYNFIWMIFVLLIHFDMDLNFMDVKKYDLELIFEGKHLHIIS